ncbi:MAG TPA: thermonuclease family protein [Actinomycetota bacterium]|nr:thermonuclease family protein [Actinomycetota bacterium]
MGRVVAGLVLFALVGGTALAAPPDDADRARVTHVTDGDTAYLKPLKYGKTASSWAGRSARFIGVDAPETYAGEECYGPEATAFAEQKLAGKKVKVTYGEDPVDPYDRALIYVWVKGRLFNATLIRKGYATTSFYAPNFRYEKWFRRVEDKAREAERGLWGACR